MSKIRKPGKMLVGTNSPVIKVDLANRELNIHLGPFMPINSGGFVSTTITSHNVIKTNSTIKIAAPAKK